MNVNKMSGVETTDKKKKGYGNTTWRTIKKQEKEPKVLGLK